MPRLREVPLAEVHSPIVLATYRQFFGDRDPVVHPGTPTGTPGHWWTVMALDQDLFELMRSRHSWQYSDARQTPPLLREFGMARAGWARGSQFVYSQHCKGLRDAGATEEQIASVPGWSTAECFSPVERAVLGYADDLVLDGGRCSEGRWEVLHRLLSDVQILELTFMILTYDMSATMCKALRLEYDDLPDNVVQA